VATCHGLVPVQRRRDVPNCFTQGADIVRLILSLLCFFFLATVPGTAVFAISTTLPDDLTAASPSDKSICQSIVPTWTEDEQRVWIAVCRSGQFGESDRGVSNVSIDAVISADFLRTILLTVPFRTAIGETGIILRNVEIVGPLRLSVHSLPNLVFFNSVLDVVDLSNATVHGHVVFVGCRVAKLDLTYAHVDGGVFFDGVKQQEIAPYAIESVLTVVARGLTVERRIFIANATVNGIDLSQVEGHGDVVLENVRQTVTPKKGPDYSLSLYLSKITGDISFFNVYMNGLKMDHSKVGAGVWIKKSKFEDLNFETLSVGENINLQEVEFGPSAAGNWFDLLDMNVGRSAYFTSTVFNEPIQLTSTNIHRDFSITGGTLVGMSAEGITVVGNLILTPAMTQMSTGADVDLKFEPMWTPEGFADFSFSSIGRIVSPYSFRAWPPTLFLHGAVFGGFIPLALKGNFGHTPEAWLPQWLLRGTANKFEPEPYQTVIRMLASTGQDEAGVAVGYSAKDRELKEACSSLRITKCLILIASKFLVGYGYFVWLSAIWATGFILLGALIFSRSPESKKYNMPYGLIYSFDMLLPIIKLREPSYEIDLESNVRYYFYFHRLAGWVLGTFIIVGIGGWTK
jgi:hypothetical protein